MEQNPAFRKWASFPKELTKDELSRFEAALQIMRSKDMPVEWQMASKLMEHIEHLDGLYEQLEHEYSLLEDDFENAEALKKDYEDEIDNLETKIYALECDLEEADTRCAEFEAEIGDLKDEIASLEYHAGD